MERQRSGFQGGLFWGEDSGGMAVGSHTEQAQISLLNGLQLFPEPAGGFIGAMVTGWRYAVRKGISLGTLADCYAVAIPFGLMWGRLGCLGGGCCFGKPAAFPFGWEVPWSVTYTARGHLPDVMLAQPLHPAPVYAILHAAWLVWAVTFVRKHQRFEGEAILAFAGLYGVGRSVLEVFRADVSRGMYFGGWLSTSQIIGLTTAAAAFALWAAWRRASFPS